MTVILILATFLIFILLDWILSLRKAPFSTAVVENSRTLSPALEPAYVDGFLVPQQLSYHPGHGWLVAERKGLVRLGVDDFAAALIGRVEKVELPKPGQWIRQGQKVWTFYRNGEKTGMVSPTEGEVVEVNHAVLNDPSLMREDPYGRGWLVTMHVPDEECTTRNLIPDSLVRTWMRDAVERLYSRQPRLAGAAAADGGRPSYDLLAGVPDANWKEVTSEFFLT